MRLLTVFFFAVLLGCPPSEPVAADSPSPPPAQASAASGDYLATQLDRDDRTETPPGEGEGEEAFDAGREAVDAAARQAGLVEHLAGERPKTSPSHRMIELQKLGRGGQRITYGATGAARIEGRWILEGARLDMMFQLFDGTKRDEDAWVACTWTEADAVVGLVCGMAKATRFGTASYGIEREGAQWTLSLKDEASAREDDWPLRMVVETL